MRRIVFYLALLLFTVWSLQAMAADAQSPVGKHIQNFRLQDFRGAWHELKEIDSQKLVVVAFLGTECPLARQYGPRLAELAAKFADRNVVVIGIDSNQQDSLAELAHYAEHSNVTFPLLKDPGNQVADDFGARRTPEVFLLDHERVVRYYGRIDDRSGIGYNHPAARENYLNDAIEDLLAGRDIARTTVEPVGCLIGRVAQREPQGDITYSRDIAVIFNSHCVKCHRAGEIAPFSLTSYDEVAAWSETIREVVSEQRMPPWHANPEHGSFTNDRRLPDGAREKLFAWIDNGMPEGDPKELPPLPQFTEGWQIPQPDLVLEMPEAYQVPATGVVDYKYFELDYTVDEDKWVIGGEARPGNPSVVHHLILFYVPPGYDQSLGEASLFNTLAGFAPGLPGWHSRAGVAKRIPAGSKLYMQLHYTPNGTPQHDRSRAGLLFASSDQVRKVLRTGAVLNYQFAIPPQAKDFQLEASHRFNQDMYLVSLLPHMHLRGKSFQFEAIFPSGEKKILLDVPRYDFNWQNIYILKQPVHVPEGTILHCTASYDNSEDNLHNPDPTKIVTWGDQTWDEMMVGQYEAIFTLEDLSAGRPQIKPLDDGRFEVTFGFKPTKPVSSVHIAGTFNEWKVDAQQMEGPDAEGRYKAIMTLEPGKYEYKFVLDGKQWTADPGNPDQAGFYNNSLLVLETSKQ